MSAEIPHSQEKIHVRYDPKQVIDYLERKGSLTMPDLAREFELSRVGATWAIMDLIQLSIITYGEGDYVLDEDSMVARKVYRLTDEAKVNKDQLKPREVDLIPMPAYSKFTRELAKDVIDACRALGLDPYDPTSFEDPRLKEILPQTKRAILNEFSAGELRQFAEENQLFRRNQD